MTHKTTHGGLPTQITLALPTTWSPEQALAVVDLLNDLRDRIWQHYDVALGDILRAQYEAPSDRVGIDDQMPIDDPPF